MLSYVNKKRRNMKDGSRLSETMRYLIGCSRDAPKPIPELSSMGRRLSSSSGSSRATQSPSPVQYGLEASMKAFGLDLKAPVPSVAPHPDPETVSIKSSESVAVSAAKKTVVDLENPFEVYTDYAKGVLVRIYEDGSQGEHGRGY